jgi:predicted  nucleic acid-binding Zn-ribbon protein
LEREKKDAADAARAAETRAKASEKKLEKLANAKKAALEAESRTVRAESRISALEMELAAMRERVERAEEERDEAKAESKAMAVWRIETDEAARSSDHASLSAAVDEAELILAPFAEEDGDEDIDTILSPQAKSTRAGHRDETNTRSKHPLVAAAARAAGNMGRREARLGDLLSALTGEMAASKRAEKEIGALQKKVAELEMTAVAATRALEAERSGGGAFGASGGGDDPPTPSAREVASMAVGLASSAKSRIRDAEDELITTRKTIESMRCEIQGLESKLERSERLRAGLRLAADASEAMTEHVAELEASNGTLRDECMATSRVALHLHRRWRKARMDRWVEGRSRGLSSFGAEMKDAKSAVFFCFKFWRELSKGDTPMKGGVGGDKGGSSRRGSIEAGRRSSVEEDGGFTFAPNVSNAAMPPAAHQPGSTPFKDLNPFANKSD